jgi:hypothetical protein
MSFNDTLIRFGSVSMVTSSLGKNDPEIGTRAKVGNNEYLFIYNTGASSAPVGRAMTLSGVTGYSATVSSVIDKDHIIGVVYHAAIPASSYGWLLTRGIGTIATSTSVALVTGVVATVQADGYWDNLVTSNSTTSVYTNCRAKVLVSASSASTGTAYISTY